MNTDKAGKITLMKPVLRSQPNSGETWYGPICGGGEIYLGEEWDSFSNIEPMGTSSLGPDGKTRETKASNEQRCCHNLFWAHIHHLEKDVCSDKTDVCITMLGITLYTGI